MLLILVVDHHCIFVFSGFNVRGDCSCLLILVVDHHCIFVFRGFNVRGDCSCSVGQCKR